MSYQVTSLLQPPSIRSPPYCTPLWGKSYQVTTLFRVSSRNFILGGIGNILGGGSWVSLGGKFSEASPAPPPPPRLIPAIAGGELSSHHPIAATLWGESYQVTTLLQPEELSGHLPIAATLWGESHQVTSLLQPPCGESHQVTSLLQPPCGESYQVTFLLQPVCSGDQIPAAV